MSTYDTYKQIPHDLAGSRSKNRFRIELLWGVSKMFDLLTQDDFCIIFDYKCDIEVHQSHSLEFYQIKSHKVQSPYSFSSLKRIDGQYSILAKLFLLQDIASPDIPIKCAIVSNAFFKIGNTTISDLESFPFSALSLDNQKTIEKAIASELKREQIDLNNIYYIYTSMDLFNPELVLKGKIVKVFEEVKGCEPIKPNALYRLIVDTAEQKACYEMQLDDYNELIKKKGIAKKDLENMLDKYIENTDQSVDFIRTHIEQSTLGVGEKRKLNRALAKVIQDEQISQELQEMSSVIIKQLNESESNLGFEELADSIFSKISDSFSIEYAYEEKLVFIWLIIKRWEGGQYGC